MWYTSIKGRARDGGHTLTLARDLVPFGSGERVREQGFDSEGGEVEGAIGLAPRLDLIPHSPPSPGGVVCNSGLKLSPTAEAADTPCIYWCPTSIYTRHVHTRQHTYVRCPQLMKQFGD